MSRLISLLLGAFAAWMISVLFFPAGDLVQRICVAAVVLAVAVVSYQAAKIAGSDRSQVLGTFARERARGRWQFSLRELLLAALAFALAMALVSTSRPSVGTPFFRSFSALTAVQSVCKSLGINARCDRSSVTVSGNPGDKTREVAMEMEPPRPADLCRLLAGLQSEIKRELSDRQCTVVNRGHPSLGPIGGVKYIDYEYGSTDGEVQIVIIVRADDRWGAIVRVQELGASECRGVATKNRMRKNGSKLAVRTVSAPPTTGTS